MPVKRLLSAKRPLAIELRSSVRASRRPERKRWRDREPDRREMRPAVRDRELPIRMLRPRRRSA